MNVYMEMFPVITKKNQVKHQMIVSGSPCDMFNVGCMKPYMGYAPRTLEEIVKYGE